MIGRVIGGPLLRSVSYRVARPLRNAGVLSRPVGFPKPLVSAAMRRALYERDGFVLGPRLLEGDGKSMRHVKLAPGRRVDDDALESLVRAAYDDICLRLQRLA